MSDHAIRPTVLVVDDHDGFRLRARRLLERAGYDVIGEAIDGYAGVAAAARLRPDIAFVDVQLPDQDGFEVAASIRAAGSASWIVLISTHQAREFGDRIGSSAADGFIDKADLSPAAIAAVVGAR